MTSAPTRILQIGREAWVANPEGKKIKYQEVADRLYLYDRKPVSLNKTTREIIGGQRHNQVFIGVRTVTVGKNGLGERKLTDFDCENWFPVLRSLEIDENLVSWLSKLNYSMKM